MVSDCRPQVLPGAMDAGGMERSEILSMTRAGVVTAAPPKHEHSEGGTCCHLNLNNLNIR